MLIWVYYSVWRTWLCESPLLVSTDASYGFQSNTKLRMVLSVALVDAMIKDSDIVAASPDRLTS